MTDKKKKAPEKIGPILERLLSGLNLGIKVKQQQIWDVWNNVVGEHIARQAQPHHIRNMILWVNVSSSSWMQQLEFIKHTIVERLNRQIGEQVIRDIRFKIGSLTDKP